MRADNSYWPVSFLNLVSSQIFKNRLKIMFMFSHPGRKPKKLEIIHVCVPVQFNITANWNYQKNGIGIINFRK